MRRQWQQWRQRTRNCNQTYMQTNQTKKNNNNNVYNKNTVYVFCGSSGALWIWTINLWKNQSLLHIKRRFRIIYAHPPSNRIIIVAIVIIVIVVNARTNTAKFSQQSMQPTTTKNNISIVLNSINIGRSLGFRLWCGYLVCMHPKAFWEQ